MIVQKQISSLRAHSQHAVDFRPTEKSELVLEARLDDRSLSSVGVPKGNATRSIVDDRQKITVFVPTNPYRYDSIRISLPKKTELIVTELPEVFSYDFVKRLLTSYILVL